MNSPCLEFITVGAVFDCFHMSWLIYRLEILMSQDAAIAVCWCECLDMCRYLLISWASVLVKYCDLGCCKRFSFGAYYDNGLIGKTHGPGLVELRSPTAQAWCSAYPLQ